MPSTKFTPTFVNVKRSPDSPTPLTLTRRTVEIESFNGRPICYGGIKFDSTARDVYWDTIQRYLRQKVGAVFDDLEKELKSYPIDVRDQALTEARSLLLHFCGRIRAITIEKDRILRGNGIDFPEASDVGHWSGAKNTEIDARISRLRDIYCVQRSNIEGNEMSLQNMMTDKVALVKKDGQVFRDNISARVAGEKIVTFAADLPVEVGDHFLRQLPSGLVEDFIVLNPKFYTAVHSLKANWQIDVRRTDLPTASQQTVVANISASNSRVYVNSIDNSVNVNSTMDLQKISDLIAQIRVNFSSLPHEHKDALEGVLADIGAEMKQTSPSHTKLRAALQSLKAICEQATGNLVATGIVAAISSII